MPHPQYSDVAVPLLMLLAVAIIYAVALLLALISLYRLRRRRKNSPIFIWTRRIIFALAILGILAIPYPFLEPYWPQVTHVRIPSRKLPAGAQPIRIAQISDLHCDSKPRIEGKLPALIAREKPDIIVFTGDALNSLDGLPIFKNCMKNLSSIAPTYAVRGNWDVIPTRSKLDFFGGTGVTELDGKAEKLNLHGTELWLGGAPAWERWWSEWIFRNAPGDALKIFLYHIPKGALGAARSGVDLCLSGHTHGGQVVIPFYGTMGRLAGADTELLSGLFKYGNTFLYVNRGIGMEGGSFPRVRLFCRPEITILDIVPAQ